jgi:UDP-glucose:(heptosyl)LPS alpha-1,3-glucosyltransferase
MRKIYLIREKSSKFGGAEVYLSRLADALKKQGIDYQIVNSIFPRFLPSWLRIILFNFQVCLTKNNRFYFSLERIVCPDIYRAGDGVHKVFLSIENKSKLNPLHPIYLFLEKRCFNNAKRIIANSNMIKNEIVHTYDIDPNKIDVVYNGVEEKNYNYDSAFKKLSKEFSLDENASILLYVGSGFKRKGVKEFLHIVSKLKTNNIQTFVIGKEKHIERYKQLSRDLKIEEKVIFTGPRLDVDDFYTISDIFLFPTRYEPFPNVILEAMSLNNAVFTTEQCGAREILDDTCIMFDSQDFSVVEKIDKLLTDVEALNNFKKVNKLKANNFSIQLNLQQTVEIIERVQHD